MNVKKSITALVPYLLTNQMKTVMYTEQGRGRPDAIHAVGFFRGKHEKGVDTNGASHQRIIRIMQRVADSEWEIVGAQGVVPFVT